MNVFDLTQNVFAHLSPIRSCCSKKCSPRKYRPGSSDGEKVSPKCHMLMLCFRNDRRVTMDRSNCGRAHRWAIGVLCKLSAAGNRAQLEESTPGR